MTFINRKGRIFLTKKLTNQLIGVTSGRNFRELGGYETLSGKKIKMHKLLRTGNLADLSPFDNMTWTSEVKKKLIINPIACQMVLNISMIPSSVRT